MMTRRPFVLLLLIAGFTLGILAADPSPALLRSMDKRHEMREHDLFLLPTGTVWGNDLEARPSEGWFGLYREEKGSRLAEVGVQFSDDSELEQVRVESRPSGADFLFRNLPGLKAGRLVEATIEGGPLGQTRMLRLSLADREYLLRLEGNDETFADAVIILSSGDREQVLFRADGWADEAHFSVLWAGDLDRDGGLDLLVTFSPKYSMYPRDLLLSSGADPGDFVRLAATYIHYSC